MQFQIRHSIPGRIRIYLPDLKTDPATGTGLVHFLQKQPGILTARVNAACGSLILEYHGDLRAHLEQFVSLPWQKLRTLAAAALPEEQSRPPVRNTDSGVPAGRSLLFASVSLVLSGFSVGAAAIVNVGLIVWNAVPIWKRAARVMTQERRLNVDFLDGLSTVIALAQGQVFTASFVVWLISLGDWIRNRTAAQSKRAITNLLEYQKRSAWVVRNGEVLRVPATEIQSGEKVFIYAGDTIPVDGKVESGIATVDQKMVTGEAMPVLRKKGDGVYAGTLVREGKLRVIAARVGADTAAAQIVSLIESAPVTETRVQNYAEKFADRLVMPWLAGSLGIFAITGNVDRLLSMTIIDYGTGIRVAAPTSILACMTAAARKGILIKGGAQMEKLANADTMIFDKTGTLTRGTPHVVDVVSYRKRSFPALKVLQIAAALEARVNHPIAEAIVQKARQSNLTIPDRAASKYRIGMGVEAQVNGYYAHLGSSRFLSANGVKTNRALVDLKRLDESGCSTVMLAIDGELVGAVACADEIREEGRDVISALHKNGIRKVMMVTGDNRATARAVSNYLGIDDVLAETLPDEKASIIQQLQKDGRVVVMIGDGINDSPALAYADVGIAMKNGADIAHASADVVLMEDNLWNLPEAVKLSHQAMGLVRQNYGIIAGLNTLALALALPGGMVAAGTVAAVSNGSAILASLNAIRPIVGLR
jgi:heavy metal translocating P-type ATPase